MNPMTATTVNHKRKLIVHIVTVGLELKSKFP